MKIRIAYYLVNGQSVSCTVDEATGRVMLDSFNSWLNTQFPYAQQLIGGNGITLVIFDKVTHIHYVHIPIADS